MYFKPHAHMFNNTSNIQQTMVVLISVQSTWKLPRLQHCSLLIDVSVSYTFSKAQETADIEQYLT